MKPQLGQNGRSLASLMSTIGSDTAMRSDMQTLEKLSLVPVPSGLSSPSWDAA